MNYVKRGEEVVLVTTLSKEHPRPLPDVAVDWGVWNSDYAKVGLVAREGAEQFPLPAGTGDGQAARAVCLAPRIILGADGGVLLHSDIEGGVRGAGKDRKTLRLWHIS